MLSFCEDYNIDGAIRVSVTGDRNNQSWAVFSRNGDILRKNPGGMEWMAPGLTDTEITEARRVIASIVDAPFGGDVYIRFNDLPLSGRSRNYSDGAEESGVSCYSATWDLIAGCYKRSGSGLDGAALAYLIQGSPIYLLSGDKIGIGSDGEPLLANPKVLCTLVFDKEKNGYVQAGGTV